MQKIISLCLILTLALSLCGCTLRANGAEKGQHFLVSALGFDQSGETLTVYIEAVTVNSESADSDKKLTLIEGDGKSFDAALDSALKKSVRPFMFSHCGTVVFGDNISQKNYRNIYKFLYNKDEINLSLRFVTAKSAKELLTQKTIASIAVGYDLTDALARQEAFSGTNFKNHFYELEGSRRAAVNVYSLPRFEVAEENYFIGGVTVYKNDSPVIQFDEKQSFVYHLLTKRQKKGSFLWGTLQYDIETAKATEKISVSDNLNAQITVYLNFSGPSHIKKEIEEIADKMFGLSKKSGTDIFMLGNLLYKKDPTAWKKVSHCYYKYYKNSSLTVAIK